jgi:hypothetical protein
VVTDLQPSIAPFLTPMHDEKNYSAIQTTDFQNILTNIIINNNALVVQVKKKVMSTLHVIKLGSEVVHKDRSVSTDAFSLNGHDTSYIMSAKRAMLMVPTLGRESTTHMRAHARTQHIYGNIYIYVVLNSNSKNNSNNNNNNNNNNHHHHHHQHHHTTTSPLPPPGLNCCCPTQSALFKPSLYLAVNTFPLDYKNQSVYGVSGTSCCLF